MKKLHFAYWITEFDCGWRIGRCPAGIQARLGRVIIWYWPLGDPLWKENR